MKTKIKTTLAIITACLLQTIQANNYVWIHGLTDDETCWTVYQQAFTASNGVRVGYSSEQSISQAATRTWNNTNGKLADFTAHDGDNTYKLSSKNDMILIGHSMGGLVARDLQYQNGSQKGDNNLPRIKGIITLGTPHEGAQIENSLSGGPFKNLVMKLITGLITSTSLSIASGGGVLANTISSAVMPTVATGIKAGVTEVGSYLLLSCFLSNTDLGYKQCDKDMQVGSPYMNTIATRRVTVPLLCFAAEEDRWQLARLGTCSVKGTNLRTDANINTSGTIDKTGYLLWQSVQLGSYMGGAVHTGFAVYFFATGFTNPFNFYLSGLHGLAAASWFTTANYMNNGIDFDHAALVGATHVETIAENHRFLWRKWTTYKNITVPEPHDGVVPVKSQYMATNKGTDVIIPNATIKGVNHVEEFNHPNTRAAIQSTLNGEGRRGEVFRN
jgi:pimeloyl-ACP methyl ester carboxylesterase